MACSKAHNRSAPSPVRTAGLRGPSGGRARAAAGWLCGAEPFIAASGRPVTRTVPRRRIAVPQRERPRRRTVRAQVPDARFGFAGAGEVPGRNPPARHVRLAHAVEPLAPPAQDLAVPLAEYESRQVLDI